MSGSAVSESLTVKRSPQSIICVLSSLLALLTPIWHSPFRGQKDPVQYMPRGLKRRRRGFRRSKEVPGKDVRRRGGEDQWPPVLRVGKDSM